ncbi:MAG: hypothetical protein HYY46_07075 [Deltaproteobacteria bacterium]|nr:hypothetical protein [Deltaproteobacteria bacterium]
MNVFFLTQSLSLPVFYEITQCFAERKALDRAGFYLSDSAHFEEFRSAFPEIESGKYLLLKEWEIIRDSFRRAPDIEKISAYEKELAEDSLWSALVADRRIYNGPRATLRQDYRLRYSHERTLSILQTGLERMEELFDRLKPDLVVSFICVTLGEYLAYLFARSRGVAFVNLRPTRIENYIYGGESVLEPSEFLMNAYRETLKSGPDKFWGEKARTYLDKIRQTHARYEGVVRPSARPPVSAVKKRLSFRRLVCRLPAILKREGRRYWSTGQFQEDGPGLLESVWFAKVRRPLQAWYMDRSLGSLYVREKDLSGLSYAFFPLHAEPEVTLNVYSRPYLNQVEAVRLFSHSLPVKMKLLIKEHPWAVGRRPLSYYRKLLQIPNVLLAYPGIESRPLLQHAELVTVISSSVAFEAVMLKKPVATLGRAPFNILPRSMVRHVQDPDRLGCEIRDLLEFYRYDEAALLCYIATVMKYSVPVDWYSRLLGRREAYREAGQNQPRNEPEERRRQIEMLASFLLQWPEENKLVNAL